MMGYGSIPVTGEVWPTTRSRDDFMVAIGKLEAIRQVSGLTPAVCEMFDRALDVVRKGAPA